MKDVDALLGEIQTIIQALMEENIGNLSGDTLTRLGMKLASYKATLGEVVANALRESLAAEAHYKSARAKAYKELREDGKGATDAGELKYAIVEPKFREWNEAKYEHMRLKNLYEDCHDLIDSIRGRAINLQTEYGEAKRGD